MARTSVTVTGVTPLVRALKGPMFKDVNRELRTASKRIATEMRPEVEEAVRQSQAPQAQAMSATVRVHSDRVPVLAIGKVNPKFSNGKWRRQGQSAKDSRLRRGAMAHGVVYGPKGGKRKTAPNENYYRISRSSTGGRVGAALESSGFMARVSEVYLREYTAALKRAGFKVFVGGKWRG